ncbi:DUF2026 family protein [Shewanella avicenniae]|uniref:DUF2026 family protein n=1 Tax=Shewanella avicenniae TaxID=2814294 RepID=A0ABX7QNH3_9GAMM|nr:DUF2026 family protein [Shewanella avicenniae]QSX32501.1 DUF2026 family protein [Shewanella avicenniae]
MKFDITLKQYELIYKIVASVGRELSHGAGKSCQFYNVNGAIILEHLFKVKARPVMGMAFIRLTESGDTLTYAGVEEGNFYSSPDAFHCWIETENNIIDFTAPEYREALNQAGSPNLIERKMFQKQRSSACVSPDNMVNIGDFFFEENSALTALLLKNMFELPAAHDLAKISLEWCKKSRKKISNFEIINDLGEVTTIAPISNRLVGAW